MVWKCGKHADAVADVHQGGFFINIENWTGSGDVD